MRVVRGRLRRRRGRRRRPGDDPDRQLDRRPGRRHPPLPARLRPAHHRRALPAHPVRADGGARARPSTTIRTVHSHVHALGQCRKVIREHGLHAGDLRRHRRRRPRGRRGRRPDPGRDLAAAGRRDLRPRGPRRRRRGRGPQHHPVRGALPRASSRRRAGNGPVVTSFIFNVRNLPAALYKALGGFATNGVNMTKLESYMVGGEFTATQFLAEVDGHPDDLAGASARWRSWRSSPPT